MKYMVILTWTASLTAANPFKSVLQARQLDHYFHRPRAFPLQDRPYLKSVPGSYALQRRADQPSSSREAGPRYPSPGRGTALVNISAKGPANISTTGMRGAQTKKVPSGVTGYLQNHHPNHVIAGGRSTATIPYGKEMTASATGQTVVGQVIPPPGARGSIRFTVGGQTSELPITNREGKYHTAGDVTSGDAKVSASTKHGGQVQVIAINRAKPEDQG